MFLHVKIAVRFECGPEERERLQHASDIWQLLYVYTDCWQYSAILVTDVVTEIRIRRTSKGAVSDVQRVIS